MTAPDRAPSEVVPLSAAGQTARIAIRPLTPADVRAVRRLERAAYGSANPRTAFERELRNGLSAYLAAVDADDERPAQRRRWTRRGPVGWLRRRLGADEGAPILGFAGVWYTHEQLHLVTIAVDPAAAAPRHRASRCCSPSATSRSRPSSTASRWRCAASNAGAMRLYERCGFRRVGRLRNYYSDNREDAIVMLLDGLTVAEPPEALTLARGGRNVVPPSRRRGGLSSAGSPVRLRAYEAAAASLSASSSSAAGSWT